MDKWLYILHLPALYQSSTFNHQEHIRNVQF